MKRRILLVAALVAASLAGAPVSRAQSGTIAFLNPSGYTSATDRTLSAKQDADDTYHLVAWVNNLPPSPLVEFQMRALPAGNEMTFTGTRVGNTFEADLDLAGLSDGAYSLSAVLYSNLQQVDDDQVTVTVNNSDIPPPAAANTVEILSPSNGEGAGFFTPEGKAPGFLVSTIASEGTERIRVLYSMSDPGSAPEWKQCGFAAPDSNLVAQIRCAVATGDAPGQVTAIAAVANKTPTGTPPAAADDSGDAHSIIPYLQQATTVDVDPSSATQDVGVCRKYTMTVGDQQNSPIAGMNVDVHATGPGDQVQFATIDPTPVTTETDPFQAPDRGASSHRHSSENALRCSNDGNLGQQGETNVPGGDDIKHVESTTPAESIGGTDEFGRWTFAVHSRVAGATQIVAWADTNGDDIPGATEASGGGQLGWGGPPPPPVRDVTLTPEATEATAGECARIVAVTRRGGSPLGGANIDVHITGPDTTVSFCVPSDSSGGRTPDGGSHVTGAHEDGTKHLEGESNTTGQFVFGVLSPNPGTTSVQVWIDETEDDTLVTGEPTRSGQINWQTQGSRTISLDRSKARVRKGTRVRLFGAIDGATACEAGQAVQLQSRPAGGGSFTTIKTLMTDDNGGYTTRVKMRRARTFRTVAPAADPCEAAQSGDVTVRVRRS